MIKCTYSGMALGRKSKVNFADLHCHILGGVDDGARDDKEMKEMLDIAYGDGIRIICFTPHFKQYEFSGVGEIASYNERISVSFDAAEKYAREKYPDMRLFLGNEIMYHHDISDSLASSICESIAGGPFVLVEFDPGVSFFDLRLAVLNLLRNGMHPIIAHVERYGEILKKPQRLKELKELGALIQVNAHGIKKFAFGKVAVFLKNALKHSLVDFVATDAHSPHSSPPKISGAYEIIKSSCGVDYARKVCCENAERILNSRNF